MNNINHKRIYETPSVKSFETCSGELMFIPGGGSLNPNPDVPGVQNSRRMDWCDDAFFETDDFNSSSNHNYWSE